MVTVVGGGELFGLPVIATDLVDDGVVYTLGVSAFTYPFLSSYAENPWPDPPPSLGPRAQAERATALGYLACLLDDWCHDLGVEPAVWRTPRLEATRRDRMEATLRAYMLEARVAAQIVPPGGFVRLVDPS